MIHCHIVYPWRPSLSIVKLKQSGQSYKHICPWRSKQQSHRIGPDSRVGFPYVQMNPCKASPTYRWNHASLAGALAACMGNKRFHGDLSTLNVTLTLCPSGLRRCGTQPPSSTPTWLLRWDCSPDHYLFTVKFVLMFCFILLHLCLLLWLILFYCAAVPASLQPLPRGEEWPQPVCRQCSEAHGQVRSTVCSCLMIYVTVSGTTSVTLLAVLIS